MKTALAVLFAISLLGAPVQAEFLDDTFVDALPGEIAQIYEQKENADLWTFFAELLQRGKANLSAAVERSLTGTIRLVLIAFVCGTAQGINAVTAGQSGERLICAVGALGIVYAAAGDIHSLLGLGMNAVEELASFSQVLLPTMGAALAGGGFALTASVWQVATLFVSDLLLRCVRHLLLPMLCSLIALAAAGAILPKSRLDLVAEGAKKLCSWALVAFLSIFSFFLSVSNVLCGTADKTAVKLTQSAISGTVPVVGNILAGTAEALLSAAASLRGVIGVLGICSVLSICLFPLMELGIQFVFYRLAAFVASMAGAKSIDRLIGQIGDVFSLLFAMTASCALVLMVSLLVSITMVVM